MFTIITLVNVKSHAVTLSSYINLYSLKGSLGATAVLLYLLYPSFTYGYTGPRCYSFGLASDLYLLYKCQSVSIWLFELFMLLDGISEEGLGEAYDKDIAFASSLETFGGGHSDPIAVSFGGPDMVKFAIALREIGTYKEVLRSQVEQILNDRLLHMASIDHQVKVSLVTSGLDLLSTASRALIRKLNPLEPSLLFFYNCGVRASLRVPRLVPRNTYHPPHLQQVPDNSVHLRTEARQMGRNHLVFCLCWKLNLKPHVAQPMPTSLTTRPHPWEARKRFDKADVAYDQVREKFLSLKKSTRMDIAVAIGEELYSARSTFELTRFNLVGALSSIEAKKKYDFLESVSLTMDAHLQYFKRGYELLHQMEPYINQVKEFITGDPMLGLSSFFC
ncbi:hypothetical protein FXO38_18898 [Capsicum annuum]|nr:hypothetical protein FXO38_18898 [Capsicum annuum]KAF3651691.1 hypothetical protein FXO37_17904 [Capsicum annuum]